MKKLLEVTNHKITADSRVIAEGFKSTNKSILNLVRSHESGLRKFGKVTFEKSPTKNGQVQTFIKLNEPQTMLLLTYTRSNDATDGFRENLVNEFFSMRERLQRQDTIRLAGIEVRKSLTDTVRDSGEQERMHGHGYSTYTNMVYEVTGLKDEYKAWKEWKKDNPHAVGFREGALNSDELKRVELAESLIKPLLEMDKQYSEIKETLKPLFEKKELK